MRDAYRFSLEHRFIIETAPLQTYYSALMFSPSSSLLRNFFQIPGWVNCLSEVPNTWGPLLQTLEGHAHTVTSVTFSPSGQKLASASLDGIIRVWDAASGLPLQTLRSYGYSKNASVAFLPDGQKLVSGCGNSGIQIWDLASGSLFKTFEKCFILSIASSPDGQKLASGCGDDLVRIWDAASGAVLHKIKARHVISVAFSPKGQKLASASRLDSPAIRVWDVASGSQMQSHESYFTSVVFSPDGEKLVTGSRDGSVCVWDGVSRVPLFTLVDHTREVTSVVVSGQKLASGSMDYTLCIWDLVSGSLLRKFEGHSQGITSVAFSPNGQKLVSGSGDCTVRIWDVGPGSSLQEFERHPSYVTLVAFSPSGQKVASGSEDGTVILWDSDSGSLLQKLGGDSDKILSFAFSSNDHDLVYGSLDHTIKVWNIRRRLLIRKIDIIEEQAESVAFSPDGKKIVSACRTNSSPWSVSIRVWDVVWGTQLQEFKCSDVITFQDPFDQFTSVAFSPDGQKLVATMRHCVSVWDSASGWQLQTLEGYPDWVRSSPIVTAKQPQALNVFDRWVTVNQKRLIWLPPARKASKFVTSGTKIAIGSFSGIVTILNLDFKQMYLL